MSKLKPGTVKDPKWPVILPKENKEAMKRIGLIKK